MTLPVTGNQYQIAAGDYRATITELGASLRELSFRGQPVVAGHDADELPPASAGQLLVPWPNRIDHGRYEFGGAEHQLALSEPARMTAIHGLTRFMPWAVAAHKDSSVLLRCVPLGQQGYPFCLQIDALFRLDARAGLDVTITAHNLGGHPAPYGTGSHPYLTVPSESVNECELTLPASRRLVLDDRGIPTGAQEPVDQTRFDFRQAREIGDVALDDAFASLTRDADGLARARLAANGTRLELWAGEGYDWLQVFTGDSLGEDRRRKAVAIEPMTCPPNAFATGTGLITLQPAQTVSHNWGLTAARD